MRKEDCALLLFSAEPKERHTAEFLEKTLDTAIGKDESKIVEVLLNSGADPNLSGQGTGRRA